MPSVDYAWNLQVEPEVLAQMATGGKGTRSEPLARPAVTLHVSGPAWCAAATSTTPSVVATLLDAGADPAAKDSGAAMPWDLIEDDSVLKGTKVYLLLTDARFE